MKMAINLLPWRLELHQQRSRQELWRLALLIILIMLSYFGLTQFADYYQLQYAEQLQKRQSIQQQLNQVEQKIMQFQQRLQRNGKQSAVEIPSNFVDVLFQLLSELPIEQGELQILQFSASQFTLQGKAHDQAEFEQIHQFFKQHPQINQLKLSQFSPQSDGTLQFEFQLQFINMENPNALDDTE
ncbi:competence protein b [Lonepinella sp. MS14437]